MSKPLNASATTAGALMSGSTFEIPPYQREYSWLDDEVSEFWNDLKAALGEESYFLGLVILTEDDGQKQVVDGQQRILTLTLLAAALFHEAVDKGRNALAERIQADFLRSIDYDTDETHPRVSLADKRDDATLQEILSDKPNDAYRDLTDDSLSGRMRDGFDLLRQKLRADLASDPFKRLGLWTDFITNRLYFAVFVHPDTASAYRVFEVINTRGRELTTADLLKNYVLSQTGKPDKERRYAQWQNISRQFPANGSNSFVQYIRHVVTVEGGHILPKDLYDFLANRTQGAKWAPSVDDLMTLLERRLPLYRQMIDPSLEGPAEPEALQVFSALNSLSVISVRPILLAISGTPSSIEGMRGILDLVVRRIVVGNLGTGNVERRFGEAARKVNRERTWGAAEKDLNDLNPEKEEFIGQCRKRSFNKDTLAFLRRSVIQRTKTPEERGTLHFIRPRLDMDWAGFGAEDLKFWGATIGNTFLSREDRRPKEASNWEGFKGSLLTAAVGGEWTDRLRSIHAWDADAVEKMGKELAEVAGGLWY